MKHGLIPHPLSEQGVDEVEQIGLRGQATFDVDSTTWSYSRSHDSWRGPPWEIQYEDRANGLEAEKAGLHATAINQLVKAVGVR